MNNESPMHKAFTSYMHDCGCNKSTTQLSNNEEDDILVLPTDEPGLDVTVLSNDIVTNLGYKGYVPIYFQPHSVFEALKQSMEEESVAIDWYIRRQIYSKDNNDEKSAKLWGEIAGDEEEHYIQFGKRILETAGEQALRDVIADMPFRVPLSKISVVGSGIEPGDDITAFTGSYPGKKYFVPPEVKAIIKREIAYGFSEGFSKGDIWENITLSVEKINIFTDELYEPFFNKEYDRYFLNR